MRPTQNMAPIGESLVLERPDPGDYFYDERSLYRVESLRGERAVIENCLTEELIDVSLAELHALTRLDRQAG